MFYAPIQKVEGLGCPESFPLYLLLPHLSLPSPPASMPFPRALMGSVLSARRLSGAITKGYEQDVGTRTSFYGFTAFSITQSLLALGGRGFRHVPLGKVSQEDRACPHTESEWGAREEKGSPASRVWSLADAGSVHPRGTGREDGQTGLW